MSDDRRLEIAADKLLREHGYLGRVHGIYRDCDLNRRAGRWESEYRDDRFPGGSDCGEITIGDVVRIGRLAGLTCDEIVVIKLRYMGFTMSAIGQALGISRQAVYYRFGRARAKFCRAAESDPYYGWLEVRTSDFKRR